MSKRSFWVKNRLLVPALLSALTAGVVQANERPVFSPIADQTVSEGRVLSFRVNAIDPDGGEVTIDSRRLQPWMSFDGQTLVAVPGSGTVGVYDIWFVASDGFLRERLPVFITVVEASKPPPPEPNQAPSLTPVAGQTLTENEFLSLPIEATDPDGDSLTVTAAGLPLWMNFDGDILTVSPAPGDAGSYSITFVADDGGLTDQMTVTIDVLALPDDGVDFSEAPWTAYMGSQNGRAEWSEFARGVGTTKVGINRLDGPYFSDAEIDSRILGLQQDAQSEFDEGRDVMMIMGGLGSGRDIVGVTDFMNLIESDDGAVWKDIVRRQTAALASLPDGEQRLTWQLGNEINSKHFSQTMRTWANEPLCGINEESSDTVQGCRNDYFYIEYLAEYLIATSVEAADQASIEVFGEPGRIRLALGSWASASSPGTHDWGAELLNYEIKGQFAPSLAGKKVYELVHLVTTHYLVSAGHTESWRDQLISLRDTWVGQGRIEGIWATEEVGRGKSTSGLGGYSGLKTAFRYLDYWIGEGISPEESRVNFWGWAFGPEGTSVDTALTEVLNHIGDANVMPMGSIIDDSDFESYAFETENGQCVATVFLQSELKEDTNGRVLSEVSIPSSNPAAISSAQALVITDTGTEAITLSPTADGGDVRVTFPTSVNLQNGQAVLFLLE